MKNFELVDLLPWHERILFKKQLLKALKKSPRIVDWNNCINKDGLYEIVFTHYDVGLLSPNGEHIYARYSPSNPYCEYGNVPVKEDEYYWHHSGIFLETMGTWADYTCQQDSKEDVLRRFGYYK